MSTKATMKLSLTFVQPNLSDDCSGDEENCEKDDCINLEEMDALCSQKSDIQDLKLQIQLLQASLNEAKNVCLKIAVLP